MSTFAHEANVTRLDRQDLADILYGAAILGAGGGGDLEEGFGLIDTAIEAGKTFDLVPLESAEPEALVCTPYLLGAVSDVPPNEKVLYQNLPRAEAHPLLLAYDRMQAQLGRMIAGCVPCELGGSNTAVAFFVAAMRDGVVFDADPAGRAVPEITHSTYFLNGLPAAPIFLANTFGETFVIEHVADDQRAERLARALCSVSRHDISVIDHVLPARVLSPAILHGTISGAMALGRLWREAKTNPMALPDALATARAGFVAFRGQMRHCAHETRDGFTFGRFEISGTGTCAGQSYRVQVKNENVASWHNGNLHATIPDLICVIDTDTGDPVTNPHAFVGQNVAVLILPAPEVFCTPEGLSVFGPNYLGLNVDYTTATPI